MKKIQRKYNIGGLVQSYASPQIVEGIGSVTSQFAKGGQFHTMSKKDRARLDELQKKEDEDRLTIAENAEYENLVKEYRKTKEYKGSRYAKGGKMGFDVLAKKVAKNYEGKRVPKEYQKDYGKVYSKDEAKEVGNKVASKVYRQQLAKKMAKGGIVVTSIKDIPNFQEELEAGRITYRGLGLGKLYNDFYDIAGTAGTRIKVKGKEYYITDKEFATFSRGEDGKMRIRFDAPKRRFAEGGLAKVEIVNEGEVFDDKKYTAILGDFDFDGLPNVDDLEPLNKSNKKQIEQLKFSNTFKELLETKKDLDIDMDKFVTKLRQSAPKESKIYARTKTPFSILNKLVSSRLLNEKHGLKDLVGTTVAFENLSDLDAFKNKVLAGKYGRVLDFDDYYESPKDGYRAYHFIIEQSGTPIELQLKTERMKLINVLSHDAYTNKRLNSEYMDFLTNLAKDADNGNKFASKEFEKVMSDHSKVQEMLTL